MVHLTCSRKTDLVRNGGEGGVWGEVKARQSWSELCVPVSLPPCKRAIDSLQVCQENGSVCERTLCMSLTTEEPAQALFSPKSESSRLLLRGCPQAWDCLLGSPRALLMGQLIRVGFILNPPGMDSLLGDRWSLPTLFSIPHSHPFPETRPKGPSHHAVAVSERQWDPGL